MRWLRIIKCLAFLNAVGFGTAFDTYRNTLSASESAAKFLGDYCISCHTVAEPSGEREFESLDFSKSRIDNQLQLQEIIDQLTLGVMPPEDAKQPSEQDRLTAIEQLTMVLAGMREQTTSTGGQSVLRRLSRREYRNTVQDLLSIDMTMFDPTLEFPADNLSNNGDNIGDVLVTSGYLLEKYLDAADRCIEKAFAIQQQPVSQEWVFKDYFYQQPELQRAHDQAFDYQFLVLYDHPLNDKPEGAYGALKKFSIGVPIDGLYEVRVLAQALHRDTPYNKDTVSIDLTEPFRMGIRPGNTAIESQRPAVNAIERLTHSGLLWKVSTRSVVLDSSMIAKKSRISIRRGFCPAVSPLRGRPSFEQSCCHAKNSLFVP